MRVLFDQATPIPIRPFLVGHEVSTAAHEGWDRLQNGELLNAAEAAGFEVLLTTDKNMRYQQNLAGRKNSHYCVGQAAVACRAIPRSDCYRGGECGRTRRLC